MTKQDALLIKDRLDTFSSSEINQIEEIKAIRALLRKQLMKNENEIDNDACTFLKDNTNISITYRKDFNTEGYVISIGIKYKDMGIEFHRIEERNL